MSTAQIDILKAMYQYTFKSTSELAEKVPEEKRFKQVGEGKGHPLWYVGHLALSNDLFLNQWMLGGESLIPPEYQAKFAPGVMGGGPVSSDASDYPSWDEVVANYKKTAEKTIELLGGVSDEDLDGDLKGNVPEQARSFFGNLGASLVGMGMHDSHHRGQIALINALD